MPLSGSCQDPPQVRYGGLQSPGSSRPSKGRPSLRIGLLPRPHRHSQDPGKRSWGELLLHCSPLPPRLAPSTPHPSRSSAPMLFSAALSAAARDELVCSSLCWARPEPAAPVLSGLGGGTGRGPSRGASLGPENASWVQATDTGLGTVPAETKRLAVTQEGLDTTLGNDTPPRSPASYLHWAP